MAVIERGQVGVIVVMRLCEKPQGRAEVSTYFSDPPMPSVRSTARIRARPTSLVCTNSTTFATGILDLRAATQSAVVSVPSPLSQAS